MKIPFLNVVCDCIFQVNIENVSYLRSQIASQLEDSRRRLEDEERRRSMLEASLHQVRISSLGKKDRRKPNIAPLVLVHDKNAYGRRQTLKYDIICRFATAPVLKKTVRHRENLFCRLNHKMKDNLLKDNKFYSLD